MGSVFHGLFPGMAGLSTRMKIWNSSAPRFVTFASTCPHSERSQFGLPPGGTTITPGHWLAPGTSFAVKPLSTIFQVTWPCAPPPTLSWSAAPGRPASKSARGICAPSAKACPHATASARPKRIRLVFMVFLYV